MLCSGGRYDLSLTVSRHTSYDATTRQGLEIVKHRYAMTDGDGIRYVVTGRYVPGFYVGKRYLVKATVKHYDPSYSQWRLSRLTLIREDDERMML